MADTKISDMPAAEDITGLALAGVQDGGNVQVPVELLSALASMAPVGVKVMTASGTYTPTTGAKSAFVIITGGGGGGGGVGTTAGDGMGGFGGAGECRILTLMIDEDDYAVTIGTAGAGASSGNNNGTAGGDTLFADLVTSKGGTGGSGSSGSGGGTDGSTPTGSGGTLVAGSPSFYGAAGNFGGKYPRIMRGTAPFLSTPFAGTILDNGGFPAGDKGCGGPGGYDTGTTARSGGSGGAGRVIIFEFGTPS